MPQWLELQCRQQQIEFVDATPSLIELNKSDEFSHNLVFDTHLSVAGARVVAELLAAKMGPFIESEDSNNRRVRATKTQSPKPDMP